MNDIVGHPDLSVPPSEPLKGCPGRTGFGGLTLGIVGLAEGASRTLADGQLFCKIEMKITRLADTKDYKRFVVEAKPA
jgi:hypothetical protein